MPKNRASRPHRIRPTTDDSHPGRSRCTTSTASRTAGMIIAIARLLPSSPSGMSGLNASSENGSSTPSRAPTPLTANTMATPDRISVNVARHSPMSGFHHSRRGVRSSCG